MVFIRSKLLMLPILISSFAFSNVKNLGVHDKIDESKDLRIFEHKKNKERVFLLASRNSGSHFAMYLIQFFTKQVWQVPSKKYAFFDSCVDDENNYIRCHQSSNLYLYNELKFPVFPYNRNQDTLIFLVRNPKEHIYKFKKNIIDEILEKSDNPKAHLIEILATFSQPMKNQEGFFLVEFFQNIDTFLSWNEQQRLLIRFEDLMFKPRFVINALNSFAFSTSNSKIDAFLDNIDQHRIKCANLIPKFNGTSKEALHSYGTLQKAVSTYSFRKHRNFLIYAQLFDEIFEEFYPKYYDFLKKHGCL